MKPNEIQTLVTKAANAETAHDAVSYSQAALNVANALAMAARIAQ